MRRANCTRGNDLPCKSHDAAVGEPLGSESELLALAVEGAGVDAQDAGGVLAAGGPRQDQPDVFGLELLEGHRFADADRRDRAGGRGWAGDDACGQVRGVDLTTRGED